MKARTLGMYTKAVDLLEQMLNGETADKTTQGFNHIVCASMKMAFADGINGRPHPNVISAMRATEKPLLIAMAAVIENSYKDGLEARV